MYNKEKEKGDIMRENDFYTNTAVYGKKNFLKRIRGILAIAIILTGICSAGCIWGIICEIQQEPWSGDEMDFFAKFILMSVTMIVLFISLIKIAVDEKPFSQTLTWGIRIIGILFSAASIIIPRIPGYQSSGFEIFSWNSFVLIDGALLLPGLLLIILGNIIMAGFEMQKEMDEIL